MPTCLRDTPVSVSSTVLPATDPIVVTSRSRLMVCPTSGPDTNSSSARFSLTAVPQKRHLVHDDSMTRPQLRHGASRGRFLRAAATTSSSTPKSTTPPMIAGRPHGGSDASETGCVATSMLRDRLELELGASEPEQIVVDELVLAHLLVVHDDAVGRAQIEQLERAVLEAHLAVVRRHELILDLDVAVAARADERARRLELERLIGVLARRRHDPADRGRAACDVDVERHRLHRPRRR